MTYSRDQRSHDQHHSRRARASAEEGFTCRNCGMYVSCAPDMAGVRNRNHCPYCLWSRHLDRKVGGDRQSACRATMRPIGLTAKQSRNKYAGERDGELMVIHRCTVCAKVIINRIAADDSVTALVGLVAGPAAPDASLRAELARLGIAALTAQHVGLVRRRLFGAAAEIGVAQ